MKEKTKEEKPEYTRKKALCDVCLPINHYAESISEFLVAERVSMWFVHSGGDGMSLKFPHRK